MREARSVLVTVAAVALATAAAGCGTGGDELPPAAAAAPVRPYAAQPVALSIPSLGVETQLERLAVAESGELEVPENPQQAGWFEGGPVPGDLGPAVIAGHVDSHDGPAIFYRLSRLRAGDRILVDRSDGTTVAFRVQSVEKYPKDRFPTDEVYGATPEPVLRLITCGGRFDRENRSYDDNVVVYAAVERSPVDAPHAG